ncbi:hypothetical protein Tco_0676100 [Tanacetum coccineum]
MKEQKQVSCGPVYDRLPALSAKYQWFVAKSPEDDQEGTKDQFFYNIQDPFLVIIAESLSCLENVSEGLFMINLTLMSYAKDGEVVIKLMLFAGRPDPPSHRDTAFPTVFLHKVDMTSIDWAKLEGLKRLDLTGKTPEEMEEEKFNDIDMSSEIWEQMEDLKDGNFFVDLARDNSVAYSPAVASESGVRYTSVAKRGK